MGLYAKCTKRTCKRLVPVGGEAYCSEHKRQSASARGYDRDWQRLSRALIAEVGHCEWPGCDATTDLTVDHINGNTADRRRRNLRVLCRGHNTKHRNSGNRAWGVR